MIKILCICVSLVPRAHVTLVLRNGKRKTSPVTQNKGNVDSGVEIAFVYHLGKSICLVNCLISFNVDKLGLLYTTPDLFENAAFFLRTGLPYILISYENGAFRALQNALQAEGFKNNSFSFTCE